MHNNNLRPILNSDPDLALNVIAQQKREGLAPTVLTVAWHMVAIKTGRALPAPPRTLTIH